MPGVDQGNMPLNSENMQFQIKKQSMDGDGGVTSISIKEKRQQIHDILSAYGNQTQPTKSSGPKKAGTATNADMNKSTTLKNFNPPDKLSSKYNNLLKIPPGKYNSGNFKSVPREFLNK